MIKIIVIKALFNALFLVNCLLIKQIIPDNYPSKSKHN